MAGALVTTNVLQTGVAMGMKALRERVVLPRIANREYEQEIVGMKRNSTVNIAVPAAITARSVSPDVVPPAVTAVTPTSVALTLDQWYEAPFAIDDKGIAQMLAGIIPMQMSEAIKAMANNIDDFLWGLCHDADGFYGYAGTAGTAPFANDLSTYLTARKLANQQLMDKEPRFMIINDDAEANALGLRAFQDASFRGDTEGIVNGQIGRKLGALWLSTQNVPDHTAGTASGATTDTAGYAVGVKVVTLASAGTGTILVGDIITFAGDTQTYVVTTGDADVSGGGTVNFEPGLKIALATSAIAITVKATHACNMLLHRDAIGFAMAPLADQKLTGGELQAVAIDEESGLSLRLKLTRQHKQYQWSFDALYGGKVIRREGGVRLAG